MAQIGTFTSNGEGYSGWIDTLMIHAELTLEPIRSSSNKAPNFRMFSGKHEAGVAFRKKSEKGNPYLAVVLDDPSLASPIWCNLLLGGKGKNSH
jgi:uncharacterized protein (DUF736 family)